MPELFPFAEYWWLYAAFTGGVLLLLFVDLFVLHRDAHEVRFREALGWSAAWVSLALSSTPGCTPTRSGRSRRIRGSPRSPGSTRRPPPGRSRSSS